MACSFEYRVQFSLSLEYCFYCISSSPFNSYESRNITKLPIFKVKSGIITFIREDPVIDFLIFVSKLEVLSFLLLIF